MAMTKEKVSIIIPVYNVEKFLKRNIESVINQTYENFEAIYVDDGSTDNSLKILKEYETKDKRIKIIHTKNFGVSHARNAGINKATGSYITFIDGDDYIDGDYIEYLLALTKTNNSKIGIVLDHHINDSLEQPKQLSIEVWQNIRIIRDIYLNRIYMAVWNKMYATNFLKQNRILFDESLWYAEGMHFNIQCLSHANKVAVGNKKIYHYCSNPASAMRKSFNISNENCALKSLNLQRNILNENKIKKCNELEYHYMMVCYMIYKGIIKTETLHQNKKDAEKCIRDIHKRAIIPLLVGLTIKNKIHWLLIGICPRYMAKRELNKGNTHR